MYSGLKAHYESRTHVVVASAWQQQPRRENKLTFCKVFILHILPQLVLPKIIFIIQLYAFVIRRAKFLTLCLNYAWWGELHPEELAASHPWTEGPLHDLAALVHMPAPGFQKLSGQLCEAGKPTLHSMDGW